MALLNRLSRLRLCQDIKKILVATEHILSRLKACKEEIKNIHLVTKEEIYRFHIKIKAINLILDYDFIEITQSQGIDKNFSIGSVTPIELIRNRNKTFKILGWSGASEYTQKQEN